ncbi:MAG TPA: histidinol dehydrogenase, partial [Polyangiaceae bacterium]
MTPLFKIQIFTTPGDDAAIEMRFARRRAWLDAGLLSSVAQIFAQVAAEGDRAVLAATASYDRVPLDALRVPEAAVERAVRQLPPALRSALDVAQERIARVNRRLVPKDEVVE